MTRRFETYSAEGLQTLVEELGQPKFRAQQIFEWAYGKGAETYDDMTNLPTALRTQLPEIAPLQLPTVANKQVSQDGTRKYVLKLADGALVETVGIPSRDKGADGQPRRLTVCFSTQVGCPMQCDFCATGREGLTRNLEPGEMAWQVHAVARDFGLRASNAVAMGQGEPFLNYEKVLAGLRILNHAKGLGIGARHITVSTCGLVEGIERFGTEPEQFTLALSLHAAQQSTRDKLMPGVSHIPLPQLHQALETYCMQSGRRASLEYLLVQQVNDSPSDLDALIDFCRGLPCHVNLLPINAVPGSVYQPCSGALMNEWVQKLTEAHIQASVRDSRGSDISAACGQLKNTLS